MNALKVSYRPNVRAFLADAERVRALAEARIGELTQPPDRGATGHAAAIRTTKLVDIEGRSKGSARGGERVQAVRVTCECHLDTLHARHRLTDDQWAAGVWFRRRYLLGYKTSAVTAGYGERMPTGNTDQVSTRVLDARSDLAALAGVLSALQWAVVETVAGHDGLLAEAEIDAALQAEAAALADKSKPLPKRSRLFLLRDGLDTVCAWRTVHTAS